MEYTVKILYFNYYCIANLGDKYCLYIYLITTHNICRCKGWSVLLAYLMTDQHGKPDTLVRQAIVFNLLYTTFPVVVYVSAVI